MHKQNKINLLILDPRMLYFIILVFIVLIFILVLIFSRKIADFLNKERNKNTDIYQIKKF